MNSKSWLLMFFIGVGGFCAMGFMTKYLVESNPTLVRIGKLKEVLAEDFSSQNVREISVRVLKKKNGFQVRVESPQAEHADSSVFARTVAESIVQKYEGRTPRKIHISLVQPGSFGCQGSKVYYQTEIETRKISEELTLRAAVARIEASLPPGDFRFRPVRLQEPLRVEVEMAEPENDADLSRAFALLERGLRDRLAAGTGRTVILSLWSAGPSPRLLREETIDRSSSKSRTRRTAPPSGK